LTATEGDAMSKTTKRPETAEERAEDILEAIKVADRTLRFFERRALIAKRDALLREIVRRSRNNDASRVKE
jgi:hypothetical protein